MATTGVGEPQYKFSKSEWQKQLADAEARGRAAAASATGPANSGDTDAARAAGAVEERTRLSQIDENTLPGYESLAAACKSDGSSVGKFVMAQNALEKAKRERNGTLRPAPGAGLPQGQERVFTAAELSGQIKAAAAEGRRIGPQEALAELQCAASGLSLEQMAARASEQRQAMKAQGAEQMQAIQTNAIIIRAYQAEAKAQGRRLDVIEATQELELLGRLKRY